MIAHSSILARRIPWTDETGGSQRIGHNWSDWAQHTAHCSRCAMYYIPRIYSFLKLGICTFWPPSPISPTSAPNLWQIAVSSLYLWVGFYFLCFFFFLHLRIELLFPCWYILGKSFLSCALQIFSPSLWLIFSFSGHFLSQSRNF